MKVKLSFVQRMELHDTGYTQIYMAPRRLSDDSITFGKWIKVFRKGHEVFPVTQEEAA